MKNRVVSTTEFRARCIALLDEVGQHGGTITVTRRGQPVATFSPARRRRKKTLEGQWTGKVNFTDEDFRRARAEVSKPLLGE